MEKWTNKLGSPQLRDSYEKQLEWKSEKRKVMKKIINLSFRIFVSLFLPWLRDPTLSVWFARNVWKFLSWNFIYYWIKWRRESSSSKDVNMSFGQFRNESWRWWWWWRCQYDKGESEWRDASDENSTIVMLVIRGSGEEMELPSWKRKEMRWEIYTREEGNCKVEEKETRRRRSDERGPCEK